ncbi:class I SAM-dependent methyltransferase [Candidatus Palauibacter sp.]|uniref:class I SAM-dependent methyltransferase n=1 Tax=Candidatus Palauibacter sp. TaxID=3101350 RepID=UPI003B018D8F
MPQTPEQRARRLRRLARAGVEAPPGLHFVSADLARMPVTEALAESGFDGGRRAFFSLLGLTYYLEPDVLAETARSIAGGAAVGSEVVLDHLLDAASSLPEQRERRGAMEAHVAKRGERSSVFIPPPPAPPSRPQWSDTAASCS